LAAGFSTAAALTAAAAALAFSFHVCHLESLPEVIVR
jgi:hypothetical protein